jgi:hypothetical protein
VKRRFQSLPFKCNLQRYTVVGLYTLNPVDLQLQSARFQPLHLSSESLVSTFAFQCDVYRYTARWSHWLLSHAAAWQRDDMRIADLMPRVNTLPLGSGALAGNPFGVDRQALAADLGFERVCPNSMDAVSDRDYVVETMFWAGLALFTLFVCVVLLQFLSATREM